ncbi:aminotransferase DegT [Methylobacillus sp. MM3]|uniref:LegC family aminotransferase n=1 Tax=Methylobacillus sp. MM3 TaxID=1848039 RepID=UPI0007DEAA7C|nr:LegC family aminotransferase [Methylobacillus sp. MM3]OAJ71038.1 aminotransferase DegT [Methylobacillus sp. MM3]
MNNTSAQSPAVSRILQAIRAVVGDGSVALHEPRFAGNEWAYLKDCLDSTFVSSVGRYVDRFEADLAAYTGARHAVAVVNGTAALHVALQLAGVQAGDEVLVPALTFVATANAVAYCGAIPHFVDSEERTLGLDPQALRDYLGATTELRDGRCVNLATGRVIRAVIPMHAFGHPLDIEGVLALARDFHLEVVEDATESLGSTIHGKHTGTFGRMGVLSFNGNKVITTGGGGAILTDDTELAKHAKHLTTTAKLPHRWAYVHDEIGYNYRLPNINAALGCAQLEQLSGFVEAKRRLHARYQTAFAGISEAHILVEPEGCRSNYWLQTLLLDEPVADLRDELLQATNDAGLMTRPVWMLMHNLPPYRACPSMPLPVSGSLEKRIINLPSSVTVGSA